MHKCFECQVLSNVLLLGFFLFKDYLKLVFINKENKKYFPPQKLLTLESDSLHSTVFGEV